VENLGGHKFKDNLEVATFVAGWLITEDRDVYRQGTEKLVPLCDKWLSYGGDYVEMQWDSRTINFQLF